MRALGLAKDNYHRFKTNILHIQAFFTCLIKKINKTENDYIQIKELLQNAGKSLDKKAGAILREMQAEYDFYIEHDAEKAIRSLKESMKINPNDYFSFKALVEIYKNKGMFNELDQLNSHFPDFA